MIFIVVMIVSGVVGASIASSRSESVVGWFLICFFLPLIGHILLAVLPSPDNADVQVEQAARPLQIANDNLTAERAAASNPFQGLPPVSVDERWNMLVEYDPLLREAAALVAPLGPDSVGKLRDAYFVLQDRSLVPGIVARIREKHAAEAAAYAATARRVAAEQQHRPAQAALVQASRRDMPPHNLAALQSPPVPRHTSVTQHDLETAEYVETFEGVHLYLLLDGRTYVDGQMALVSLQAARDLISQVSRPTTASRAEHRSEMRS
jgi:hypothetical protein